MYCTGKIGFCIDSPVRTYQYNAYALGAILALGDEARVVLDNNFIYIESSNRLTNQKHPIYFCPFIGPTTFYKSGFGPQVPFRAHSEAEVSAAISACLRLGYHARLLIDEYYIPDRWTYGKLHRIHDVLITGESDCGGSVTIVGYCTDGRYKKTSCRLDLIAYAYMAVVDKVASNGFIAFRAMPSKNVLELDKIRIRHHLQLLLASQPINPSETGGLRTASVNKVYGVATFDVCEEYLGALREGEILDPRIFSVLFEHARAMRDRTQRLLSQDEANITKMMASAAAYETANRLKLLSLLPPTRRHNGMISQMITLCRKLKDEIKASAEGLYDIL